jgi:hypothetical protein
LKLNKKEKEIHRVVEARSLLTERAFASVVGEDTRLFLWASRFSAKPIGTHLSEVKVVASRFREKLYIRASSRVSTIADNTDSFIDLVRNVFLQVIYRIN